MITIKDKSKCSGCAACSNICPTRAISMQPDEEGFLYPVVELEHCVQCGACDRTCPIANHDKMLEKEQKQCIFRRAYAIRNRDEAARELSSSGGVFYAVAQIILRAGGFISGVTFDENFRAHHTVIHNIEELPPLVGSKYVQSDIGNVYQEIRSLLENGNCVLFVGMSCQIEGLQAYLNKDYENLYCIDLICMGIPSPGVWNKYLNTYFDVKKIKSINFKDKTQGWHKFSVAVHYRDNTCFLQTGQDNFFMQSMFKGYSLRPTCFSCQCKSESKISDLTIADCWGCDNYLPEMDDNKGLSMVIAHTKKGMAIVEMLRGQAEVQEFDYENVIRENPNYVQCAKKPPFFSRKLFAKGVQILPPRIVFEAMCKNPYTGFVNRVKRKLHLCR